MKRLMSVLSMAAAIAGVTGCATVDSLLETDKEVPLSEVPAPVIDAAKGAVKGIVLSEAEIEEEDGQTVYELEGTADGKTYEIEVTAEGKVLEVEQDD